MSRDSCSVSDSQLAERVEMAYRSMSILCEDVLESLRNATPCFMVVDWSGGK